jgi:hypothetical protein
MSGVASLYSPRTTAPPSRLAAWVSDLHVGQRVSSIIAGDVRTIAQELLTAAIRKSQGALSRDQLLKLFELRKVDFQMWIESAWRVVLTHTQFSQRTLAGKGNGPITGPSQGPITNPPNGLLGGSFGPNIEPGAISDPNTSPGSGGAGVPALGSGGVEPGVGIVVRSLGNHKKILETALKGEPAAVPDGNGGWVGTDISVLRGKNGKPSGLNMKGLERPVVSNPTTDAIVGNQKRKPLPLISEILGTSGNQKRKPLPLISQVLSSSEQSAGQSTGVVSKSPTTEKPNDDVEYGCTVHTEIELFQTPRGTTGGTYCDKFYNLTATVESSINQIPVDTPKTVEVRTFSYGYVNNSSGERNNTYAFEPPENGSIGRNSGTESSVSARLTREQIFIAPYQFFLTQNSQAPTPDYGTTNITQIAAKGFCTFTDKNGGQIKVTATPIPDPERALLQFINPGQHFSPNVYIKTAERDYGAEQLGQETVPGIHPDLRFKMDTFNKS